MTLTREGHLSEEALQDVLIGMSSAEADAHVAVCKVCRGQLEEFRSEVQLFDQAGLAWCEAKPVKRLRANPQWHVRQAMLAPVGWAMAAMVLLMIGIPTWIHDHSAPDSHAVVASMPADSAVEIAQDNELLRSVDGVLSANEESPLTQYHLSNGSFENRNPGPRSLRR
jgi:hypothetical protein